MLESCGDVSHSYGKAANRKEAERLGRILVEEQLSACAALLPGSTSIYRWEGVPEMPGESLVSLKANVANLSELEARVAAMHSYTTPEMLVVTIEAGSTAYLKWKRTNLPR